MIQIPYPIAQRTALIGITHQIRAAVEAEFIAAILMSGKKKGVIIVLLESDIFNSVIEGELYK